MTAEVRQRTISIRLAGEDDWTTHHFGEALPRLDPFGDISIDAEIVKPQIKDLRDFFIDHGSGRPGCGLSKNTPEAGISVHGLVENGEHVIFVQTDECQPSEPADKSCAKKTFCFNSFPMRTKTMHVLCF